MGGNEGAVLREALVALCNARVQPRDDPSINHGQIGARWKDGRRDIRIAQVSQGELCRIPNLVAEMVVALHAQNVEVDVARAWEHVSAQRIN